MSRFFEFDTEPKKKEKIKMMLWIETETVARLERIRPEKLSIQECIRQIINNYLDEQESDKCSRCNENIATTVYGLCDQCESEYQRQWDKD